MSKVEIEFEITGLKLKIKGEREDASQALNSLQRHISGVMQVAGALPDMNGVSNTPAEKLIEASVESGNGTGGGGVKKTGARPGRSAGDRAKAEALEFRHDAATYGNPLQTWGNTEKIIWLLFVLQDTGIAKEVNGPQIAATFSRHFKGAGAVRPSHTTRELGRAKMKNPAWVGEDKSQEPSLWYLTDEGKKQGQQLVKSLLNPA
jgi:hypothetical protein